MHHLDILGGEGGECHLLTPCSMAGQESIQSVRIWGWRGRRQEVRKVVREGQGRRGT